MKPDPAKSPKLSADALVVLGLLVLGVIAFSALWMGYDLVRMLIVKPMEPANLAVFVGLVGSITSICGTAIGFVGGAIFGARRQPSIGPITGDNASIGTGAAPSAAQPTGAESGNDSAATTGSGS